MSIRKLFRSSNTSFLSCPNVNQPLVAAVPAHSNYFIHDMITGVLRDVEQAPDKICLATANRWMKYLECAGIAATKG